jgi:DNA processing protein
MGLPPEAHAAALAGLPGMGPARLLALLRTWTPGEAWRRVRDKTWVTEPAVAGAAGSALPALRDTWAASAREVDVEEVWRAHVDAGVGVIALGSASYPEVLAHDVEPAAVLFVRGDANAIAGPRVAIVGTRGATQYGLDVAFDLACELGRAGVAIVSGLALGIDGAAHAGCLAGSVAPPIAVVGSGLDVVYPRANASLWREVERRGVVLSEAPLGAAPERWRFPARNRIIAALADAVVVVESRSTGGSMHTVAEAERRGRPVFAAPGPVRSASSAGTNRLLRDGAHVLCDAGDVLVTLGLSTALSRSVRDERPSPSPPDAELLAAVGWTPTSLAELAERVHRPLGELALGLARLCEQGWLAERGGWFERVARTES